MPRLPLALATGGLALFTAAVLARPALIPPSPPVPAPASYRAEPYLLHQGVRISAADTLYFGGTVWTPDSARWEAIPDSVWTFDTGVGSFLVQPGQTYPGVNSHKRPGLHGSMEGWVGMDASYVDAAPFLRRLSSDDPRWDGDPCVGAAGGLGGMTSWWVGAFAGEADSLCFLGGRGYGNDWRACLDQEFAYAGGDVRLQFDYRVDTEESYDLLQVFVDSGGSAPIAVATFSGTELGHADLTLSYEPLPFSPKPVTLRFCLIAAEVWSDEDGLFTSECGAFALDDIDLSGGIVHTADFETGDDGWAISSRVPEVGGDWSHLAALVDLPALPDTLGEPCDLVDSVLVFFDPEAPAHNPHPLNQNGFAISPWIDLERAGALGGYTGRFIELDVYSQLTLKDYIFGVAQVQWYPGACDLNGAARPSEWVSTGFVLALGFSPACWSRLRVDFSNLIPGDAKAVRIALGVESYCHFLAGCTRASNTTPWLDNVRFGVYRENPIQTLIALSSPGDTLLIPPGTYLGSEGYRDIDLRGKNIVVWAPAGPESTIIDCEGLGRGFTFSRGEDSTCVLDGLTIRNGVPQGSISTYGGGIGIVVGSLPISTDASPTIRNCVIEHCSASLGGGLYAGGSPTILDCIFRDNSAETGGGAFLIGTDIVMQRCILAGNTATEGGGGMFLMGGHASDTEISGNRARQGGGVLLRGDGTLSRSRIRGNTAVKGGGVGIFSDSQQLPGGTVADSEITGNLADLGGGIHVSVTEGEIGSPHVWEAWIIGSTVASNYALTGGGVYAGGNWNVEFTRSISWWNHAANEGRELYVEAGTDLITSCADIDSSGAVDGPGSVIHAGTLLDADPRFCSAALASDAPTTAGDYSLAAGSPCLPESSPCDSLIGAEGFGCAVVPVLPPPEDAEEPPFLTTPGILAGPNPFTGELAIHYLSPSGTRPRVEIFSLDGRRVASYEVRPGSGKLLWPGRDESGQRVASGVYFVRFTAGDLRVVRRVVRTR